LLSFIFSAHLPVFNRYPQPFHKAEDSIIDTGRASNEALFLLEMDGNQRLGRSGIKLERSPSCFILALPLAIRFMMGSSQLPVNLY
jgi:hypothetical protein